MNPPPLPAESFDREHATLNDVRRTEERSTHAGGAVRRRAALEALSAARDARPGELGSDTGPAFWEGLAQGRLSFVDSFDSEGRRYLIARVNPLTNGAPSRLSQRERQIAGLVASGHSNKSIAYELGLSPATVAVLLGRALRKLGVGSRVVLARLRQVCGNGGPC
jgi:DNA-binding CsgD family transcriptional regulator